MKCEEFVELVTAYLDGALDPAVQRRFVRHIRQCVGCDRYLDQFRRTITELGHLPAETIGDEARDRLLTAFRDWSTG